MVYMHIDWPCIYVYAYVIALTAHWLYVYTHNILYIAEDRYTWLAIDICILCHRYVAMVSDPAAGYANVFINDIVRIF